MEIQGYCVNCMERVEPDSAICRRCGFDQTAYRPRPHCLRPGTLLGGKYVTGRVLGQGGFGITYLGYDLEARRTVAIKELFVKEINTRGKEQQVLTGEADRERFERNRRRLRQEEEILSLVGEDGQDSVVRSRDHFEEKDTSYLVMELLEGLTLKQYVSKEGKLPFDRTRELLAPVCQSLIRAHALGIVHKDVAPDNIMILRSGRTKLMDFGGTFRLTEKPEDSLVTYKRGYAPPEQYLRAGNIGPWTDVYALAATIYFTLTGEKPPDVMERKIGTDVTPLGEYQVVLPDKQEEALMKALSMDPKGRFARMEEFYQAVFA